MRAVATRALGADPRTARPFRYPLSTYAVGTLLFMAVFLTAHLEQFVHDPVPQVVEEMVQFIPQELFSKCFFDSIVIVSSGIATPVTVHPDSSEDREGSSSAVP